jgi:hypothetical protein
MPGPKSKKKLKVIKKVTHQHARRCFEEMDYNQDVANYDLLSELPDYILNRSTR